MRESLINRERGSLELMKKINKSIILDTIRIYGPISRAEISQKTNLSPTTVSTLTENLIKEEYVKKIGEGKSRGGRRPILLKFNSNAHFIPDYHGRINFGPLTGGGQIGCPSATIDKKGRFIAVFNCSEGKYQNELEWAGCMTLPWHLSLKSDNILSMVPVYEIKSLRFNHQKVEYMEIQANEEHLLKPPLFA